MSKLFSERNGLIKPSSIIIKNGITENIINAISSCFSRLRDDLDDLDYNQSLKSGDDAWMYTSKKTYGKMDLYVWTDLLNQRANKYIGGISNGDNDAVQQCILDKNTPWYKKIDCVEFAIAYMTDNFHDADRISIKDDFVKSLNKSFERLNYGYRIVEGRIVDIISNEEIHTIEDAINDNKDTVAAHMQQALVLYSDRQNPDYRNSIKESITAVETLLRDKTGETTFGNAFNKIKIKTNIHPRLEEMIQKVYDYTNQKDTGIRHAKVEGDNTYLPQAEEALFMLITCSAIINFINSKTI